VIVVIVVVAIFGHVARTDTSFDITIEHSKSQSEGCLRIRDAHPVVLVIPGYAPWKQISSPTSLPWPQLSMEIHSGSRTLVETDTLQLGAWLWWWWWCCDCEAVRSVILATAWLLVNHLFSSCLLNSY